MHFKVGRSSSRLCQVEKHNDVNVNFLTLNVGPWTCYKQLYGDIDRKIIFLCPLRYIFEASVHFKVGRSSSRLCQVEKHNDGNVNFLTLNVESETSLLD